MYGQHDRKLTIGLDFDDTVTKNPIMFREIIAVMKDHGCDIYIVTARQDNGWCHELRDFVKHTGLHVIFTGAKAKRDIAEIDIWIDDFPLAITHDFKETKWQASENTKKDYL